VFAEKNFPTHEIKFHGYAERWMPMIIPGHAALRRKVQIQQNFIDGKIGELDHILCSPTEEAIKRRWNAYNSDSDAVSFDAHEFGVAFGILIGLKWAGLSRLEIRQRAEGLILQVRHDKERALEMGRDDD
jgi:hypothetical protein